jgi:hypothetical protein
MPTKPSKSTSEPTKSTAKPPKVDQGPVFRKLCTHITNNESWAQELRDPDTADLKVSDSKILSFLRDHFKMFWKPGNWHGTSLPMLKPDEKGGPLLQSGLAIVTSPRLPDGLLLTSTKAN